jgi:hypothetical protein
MRMHRGHQAQLTSSGSLRNQQQRDPADEVRGHTYIHKHIHPHVQYSYSITSNPRVSHVKRRSSSWFLQEKGNAALPWEILGSLRWGCEQIESAGDISRWIVMCIWTVGAVNPAAYIHAVNKSDVLTCGHYSLRFKPWLRLLCASSGAEDLKTIWLWTAGYRTGGWEDVRVYILERGYNICEIMCVCAHPAWRARRHFRRDKRGRALLYILRVYIAVRGRICAYGIQHWPALFKLLNWGRPDKYITRPPHYPGLNHFKTLIPSDAKQKCEQFLSQ